MRVLIVEDDPTTAKAVARTVERFGYRAEVRFDSGSAWELLCEEPIPIVVTDWSMPGEDGVTLCQRIRAASLPYYTYVVFVTNRSTHDDVVQALSAGADDLISKPFNPDELRVRLLVAERIVNLETNLRRAADELRRRADDLDEKSKVDALMQIGNRAAFEERVRELHQKAAQQGRSYAVLMSDVDHFKCYNDTFGHQGGDEILRRLADAFKLGIRSSDWPFRYGGEEIVALLPDLDLEGARRVAERVRRQVESVEFELDNADVPFRVTISCGVAACSKADGDLSYRQVIEQADRALYHAKRTGRNRVVASDELLAESDQQRHAAPTVETSASVGHST